MKTHTIKTYSFDELANGAKEKAIERHRTYAFDYEWYDSVYEDAKELGRILGITIDRIYFSGFCSQGDGACFEGNYAYAKKSAEKIKEYAPQDTKLLEIAQELQTIQQKHLYGLTAQVKHSGHYYHEYCTNFDVCSKDGLWVSVEVHDELAKPLRDFMKWIYRQLEKEYDYLSSDEQIIDSIKANEYEFYADGSLFDFKGMG